MWFRGLLRRLAAEGKTIVLATHLLGEVAMSADRIVLLDRGRLRTEGELDRLVPGDVDQRHWLESTLMESA